MDLSWLGEREMKESEVQNLTQEYLEGAAQKWGTLRSGDAEIPLSDVFVMLEALARPKPRPLEQAPELPLTPERWEHAGLELPNERRREPPRPILLSRALKEATHLVLLGETGAGKTTTLQFVGLCFARSGWARERLDLEEDRIPVFISLNAMPETSRDPVQ